VRSSGGGVIPPFDPATGNLPPGIHEATWEEIVGRYGTTPYRRQLLEGFRVALDVLRSVGCRRVYLDGSFVTTKEVPGDFDACWETTGVNLPRLGLIAPGFFDLRRGRREQKRRYGGELIHYDPLVETMEPPILDVFQHDKHTDAPKGIIAIMLGELL
jgi:hypothetical protein